MSNRDETASLIAKLEEATEASRELDGAIAIELGWTYMEEWAMSGAYWLDLNDQRCVEQPHYTTSIDAALTLVERPMGWSVGGSADAEGPMFGASVDVERDLPALSSCCATPAIALTVAALKARARRSKMEG